MKKRSYLLLMALATSMIIISCDKEDDIMGNEEITAVISVENIVPVKDYVQSGVFKREGDDPRTLPGQSASFKFNAGKGQHLALATMYGVSKDWFFAPENPGLKLYDESGKPFTGDVSSQIKLWDNGSKDNTSGAAESKNITEVPGVDASTLMKLTLAYDAERSEFTLTINNTSGGTKNETGFSPGVWAISNVAGGKLLATNPFFEKGKPTNPEITPIAEHGQTQLLAAKNEMNTGVITGVSPLVVVTYSNIDNPIFKVGTKDIDNGLKEVAQTGNPAKLTEYLKEVKGVRNVYVFGDGPIGPGASAMGSIRGAVGDKLAFVSMSGYSNDWFYANSEELTVGFKGDLVPKIGLYDNGTAKDQFLGAGNSQAVFGGAPQIPESKVIEKVGNELPYPATADLLRISIK